MQKNKDLFSANNWPGQKNKIFSLNKNTQNTNIIIRKVCYFCQKGFTHSEYEIHIKDCEEKLKIAESAKTEQIQKEENKISNKKSDDINETLKIELNEIKNFMAKEDNQNNLHISIL